jgi:hypothetical protein
VHPHHVAQRCVLCIAARKQNWVSSRGARGGGGTFINFRGYIYQLPIFRKLINAAPLLAKCSPPIQEFGSTGMGRGAAFSQNGGCIYQFPLFIYLLLTLYLSLERDRERESSTRRSSPLCPLARNLVIRKFVLLLVLYFPTSVHQKCCTTYYSSIRLLPFLRATVQISFGTLELYNSL